jgi:RHH-type proline utilization regulon transcriptional repressor/proline dehydrogenase/delta 1-pyrroline-5-carboxylate dehydrogenase
VCISPWNFPLAIFLGQIAAALLAGNAVVAKSAEQTPLIAKKAIHLLHTAGIPPTVLHLLIGDGALGATLVKNPLVAGVAFTGSSETAHLIHRALAATNGPIATFIAETGGINPMIVDGTALPEQVTDDVITSTFRSAGQRCSALRLLCLQTDTAEKITKMIIGATRELEVGDPRLPSTHVGPVIDAEARERLESWLSHMEARNRLLFRWDRWKSLPLSGTYFPPCIVKLESPDELEAEVFGPILHIVHWQANELDRLLEKLTAKQYALTLGVQSRIDSTVQRIVSKVPHGNIYVNRNMIGAVVESQPFGGSGLSGTGPKAGGPNYLSRFASEQVVTVNSAAVGGNATLLTADD